MSVDLVLRGMMVLLVTPTDVEFLHWMGVLGFGHPIYITAWSSGAISLVMVKRPATVRSDQSTKNPHTSLHTYAKT